MNGNLWVVGEMYKLQNVFHFHIFLPSFFDRFNQKRNFSFHVMIMMMMIKIKIL